MRLRSSTAAESAGVAAMSTFGREVDEAWLRRKERHKAEVIDLKSCEPASKFTLVSIADVPAKRLTGRGRGTSPRGNSPCLVEIPT